MHQRHPSPKERGHSGRMVRFFSLLMCGWLFMVPQVMFSTAVMSFCDEYGTSAPLLVEEEEVHQKDVPPRLVISPGHTTSDPDESPLPHWEELLLHTLHGEVPHPPPWA